MHISFSMYVWLAHDLNMRYILQILLTILKYKYKTQS